VSAFTGTVNRVLGWAIGGMLGVGFLVGYLAAYVPPDVVWWMDPMAVLLPVTGSLLLVVVTAYWLAGRRTVGRGGLAATVALLIALRVVPDVGVFSGSEAASSSPHGEAEALRVMTFNAPYVGGDPRELGDAVAEAVRAEDPHLLALQEPHVLTSRQASSVRHVSPQLRRLLDAEDYDLPGELPSGDRVHQPVLSRQSTDALRPLRLERPSEREFVSRVPFRWQGRRAVLYNVHLHTTVGGNKPWESSRFRAFDPGFWGPVVETYRTGARRRAEQARELRRMIEQETDPVIVVGDFNSTQHHWVYRHISGSLIDAHRAAGSGFGWTFPAQRPLVRIDHVLVSEAWEVVQTHVGSDHATSDHRPVVARLRWSDEASQ
jgi:endonuclease/exonuclease/phosphatase family metal-dependent hydrolase